ncbi:hypothetical protein Lfu02_02750 [Longispora fulva]|uniref:Uncharacterized protein n=1 Tax=Longispora fulva TaxID=619741 RepID=A0A8J7GPY8_9ACTN|nr:hypothetical protein [Longispora fulva]MBG6135853.1 hypothetical protein [Longispora fulva]GIG55903.1 hypothetical protein Lfu02_02750 [Longispora fulva]
MRIPSAVAVPAAVVVSLAGLYVHNVNDLPGQTATSPETLYPALVALGLLAAWWWGPRPLTTYCLAGWGWIHLVGGALSVLPLPVLPFEPEQTVRHYAFHVGYALAQLPLIVLTIRELRARP